MEKIEEKTESEKVDSIKQYTYWHGCELEYVEINKDVLAVEEGAFYNCRNLQSVVINGNVSVIQQGAFFDCKKLERIVINGNVSTVEQVAFAGCKNLQSIVINGNVGTIKTMAISTCLNKNLKTIKISGNVGELCEGFALMGGKFEECTVDGKIEKIKSNAFTGVQKPIVVNVGSAETIEENAFAFCNSSKSRNMFQNLAYLLRLLFWKLKKLKITFGSIGAVHECAFLCCGKISEFKSNNIGKIESHAFVDAKIEKFICNQIEEVNEKSFESSKISQFTCGNAENLSQNDFLKLVKE